MTRVTDEDLEVMVAMCAGFVTMDNKQLLGDAIRAELLTLRKVADAAIAILHCDHCENRDEICWKCQKPLIKALREAGI